MWTRVFSATATPRIVIAWFKKHFNWEIRKEWIVKTPGVVIALALAVKAFTQKGEAVIIQPPVYYPFYNVIRNNERKIIESPLVYKDGEYTIDFEDFENKIKENGFLEYVKYGVNYYGTPKDMVEKSLKAGEDIILEIDIQGALKVKETMPEGIFIFIMPPSMRELRDRLVKRNTETKEKIIERFRNAYKEINEVTKYNYIVINDEIDVAVEKVKSIILAEKCRVDRIEDFELHNQEELLHELLIEE